MPSKPTLTVELRAKDEATKAVRDLGDQAKRTGDDIERKLGKSLISTAAQLTALVGGIKLAGTVWRSFTSDFIRRGDDINKMSERLGFSVEQLSLMSAQAELAGADLGTLAIGSRQLAKNLQDLKRDTGEAKFAFEDLGLSVKLFEGKSIPEAIEIISDRFRDLEDGPRKTAAAMRIFGEAGVALIPLLNQGSGALKSQREELIRLGAVMTKDQANAASRARDDATKLSIAWRGFANTIGADLVGGLLKIPTELLNLAASARSAGEDLEFMNEQAREVGDTVRAFTGETFGPLEALLTAREAGDLQGQASAVRDLVSLYEDAAERLIQVRDRTVDLDVLFGQVPADMRNAVRQQLEAAGAIEEIPGLGSSVEKARAVEALRRVIADLTQQEAQLVQVLIPEAKAQDEAAAAARRRAEAEAAFADTLEESQARIVDEIRLLKVDADVRDAARVVIQAQAEARRRGIELADDEALKLFRLAQAHQQLAAAQQESSAVAGTVAAGGERQPIFDIIPPDSESFLEGFTDQIRYARSQLEDMGRTGRDAALDLEHALGSALDNGFVPIIERGIRGLGDAWKSFTGSVLQGLAQMAAAAARNLALRGIFSLIPGAGPLAGAIPPVFAEGGIMPGRLLATAPLPVRHFQHGGVATSPTVGIFGEGGGAGELFVPLGPSGGVPVEMRGGGQMGGPQVTQNFYLSSVDTKGMDELLTRHKNTLKNLTYEALSTDTTYRERVGGRRR